MINFIIAWNRKLGEWVTEGDRRNTSSRPKCDSTTIKQTRPCVNGTSRCTHNETQTNVTSVVERNFKLQFNDTTCRLESVCTKHHTERIVSRLKTGVSLRDCPCE